ncbi:uncharacterized protein LOC106173768 [Lingula anatina]|uniref:Uncharacterized protein LOC106173768 n=1 Tax=Lingula anatina TaxID=7574 RepID=A0A1S3JJ96_LINAN|nr:uncharacterized protein LOC106173768 [Lingula anatina]|eukprot:XP_013410457.1 uncharacterized protein LOC106173768 [Lingula anatina]
MAILDRAHTDNCEEETATSTLQLPVLRSILGASESSHGLSTRWRPWESVQRVLPWSLYEVAALGSVQGTWCFSEMENAYRTRLWRFLIELTLTTARRRGPHLHFSYFD